MTKIVTIIGFMIIACSANAEDAICKNEALRYSNVIYRSDYGNVQDVSVNAKFSKYLDDGVTKLEVWNVGFVRNDGYQSHIWSHSLTMIPEKSTDKLKSSQCILVNFDRQDFILNRDNLKESK